MKFKKGNKGRPAGARNKFTSLKQEFMDVFEKLNLDKNTSLLTFAQKHPEAFFLMVSKMLPKDITLNSEIRPEIVLHFDKQDEKL